MYLIHFCVTLLSSLIPIPDRTTPCYSAILGYREFLSVLIPYTVVQEDAVTLRPLGHETVGDWQSAIIEGNLWHWS